MTVLGPSCPAFVPVVAEPDGNHLQESAMTMSAMTAKPTEVQTQVLGTTRVPEGATSGEIRELIIKQKNLTGHWHVLDIPTAIEWAKKQLLWSCPSSGGKSAWVEPYDANSDGRDDSVRSTPDETKANNLLSLPIYDRNAERWIPAPPRA